MSNAQHSIRPANAAAESGPIRRAGGAPLANKNAIRHGLTCGLLPKGCYFIGKQTGRFRAFIESLLIERDGEVGVYAAAVLQTAIRWERHAMMAQRWLKLKASELTPDQMLAFSRDVATASANRDKALEKLGLDRKKGSDPWDIIDSPPGDKGPIHAKPNDVPQHPSPTAKRTE